MSMYGEGTSRPVVICGPGRTKQEFKEECDVNNIVRRHTRDGFLSHVAKGVPRFLDVSEVGDFRTAVDQVRAATEFFEGLPAKLRARFGNDPVKFIDDAGQLTREELREFGLAELRASDRRRRAEDVIAAQAELEGASPKGEAPGTVSS